MTGPSYDAVSKVPEVTVVFWLAKLLTAAFGVAFSDFVFFNDFLAQHLAMVLSLSFLAVCLVVQLATRSYTPWIYWLTVSAVSIFGTMSADFLNRDLGMPLYASTLVLLGLQTAIFLTWYLTQHTLDVHRVDTRLRELFYWLAVIVTFALGTAAGDFVAHTLGLGTLASAAVFSVAILLPALAHRWLGLDQALAFWLAYALTRPLGASVADWLAAPAPHGDGLQLGTGTMSVLIVPLLVLVAAYSQHHSWTRAADEVSSWSGSAR